MSRISRWRRGRAHAGRAAVWLAALAVVGSGACAEPPSPALEIIRSGNVVVRTTTDAKRRRPIDDTGRTLGVPTDRPAPSGQMATVTCAVCHSLRTPTGASEGAPPETFHQDVRLAHGGLACRACHNAPLYEDFHLADGSRVAPGEVIRLCSQCHGPQRRDYDHGIHGGMNGYWDEARGPRTRNLCTDCHAPHAPRFPQFAPARGPADRFLGGTLHAG